MLTNAFDVSSVATCPQFPNEWALEPRDASWNRQQPSRATDILTIGDNPALGGYLSALFQQSGWTITRARNCETGMAYLQDNRAAVVVCEESLPDGSWHDAAAAIRSVPDGPALIVVGDDGALVEEVLALGGFDALVRPLRDPEVVWSIASAWHAWMKRIEAGGNGALRCCGG